MTSCRFKAKLHIINIEHLNNFDIDTLLGYNNYKNNKEEE